MSVVLRIGGVDLEGFEIPSRVRFGGAQSLAVHKLPGGVRVIDAMGRDDEDLAWSGVLSGTQATSRARLLDAMRVSGTAQGLSWDVFSYSVVIERLDLDYCSPWWIPYRISCSVIQDEAGNGLVVGVDFLTEITNDLATAAGFLDVSGAIAATRVVGALTANSTAHATASVAFGEITTSISENIVEAEARLQANDFSSLVVTAGSLAQLCAARGYVGRAFDNFNLAGT